MKKILLIILVFFMMIFTFTACDSGNGDELPDDGGGTQVYDAIGFTIHFNRSDNNYTNWGLWLWEDGKDGGLYEFEGTDSYGAYVTYDFT